MGSYKYYPSTHQPNYGNGYSMGYSEPLWNGLDDDIKRILDTCEPMKQENYFDSLSLHEITDANDYLLRKNASLQDELEQLDREFSRMIPISKPLQSSPMNGHEQPTQMVDNRSQQTSDELDDLRKIRKRQKESIENLRMSIKDLESRNREKELFLEQAKYQLSDVSKRTDLLSKENGFLRREIEDLRSMNTLLRGECQQLLENMQNVSQTTEKMKEELKQNYDESLKDVLHQLSEKSKPVCTIERETQVDEQTRVLKHGAVQFSGSVDQVDQVDFNRMNQPSAHDELLLARENHILRDTCDLLKHELFSMKKMLIKQMSPRTSASATNNINAKKHGRTKAQLLLNAATFVDSSTDSAPHKSIQKHGKRMQAKPYVLNEEHQYSDQYLKPPSTFHLVTTTPDSLSETDTVVEKRLRKEQTHENYTLRSSQYEENSVSKPEEYHLKKKRVKPYTGTESESSYHPDIILTDMDERNTQLSGESATKFMDPLESVKVFSEYEDVFDSHEDALAHFLRQKEERIRNGNQLNVVKMKKGKINVPPIPSREYENKAQQHQGMEDDDRDLLNVQRDEIDSSEPARRQVKKNMHHSRRKKATDEEKISPITEPAITLESFSVSTENIPLIRSELQESKELLRQQDDLLNTLERRIPHAFHPKISHGEPKFRKKVCQENKGVSHQSEDKLSSPGPGDNPLESDHQAMLHSSLRDIQSDIMNLRNEFNHRQKSASEVDLALLPKTGEWSKQDLSLSVSLVDIDDIENNGRIDDQINTLKDSWDAWSKHLSTDMSGGFQACDHRLRTLETRFDEVIRLLQQREETAKRVQQEHITSPTNNVADHDKKMLKKKGSVSMNLKSSPKSSQDKQKPSVKSDKDEKSQKMAAPRGQFLANAKTNRPSSQASNVTAQMKNNELPTSKERNFKEKEVEFENDNEPESLLSTARLDSGIALDMPTDLLNNSAHLSMSFNTENEHATISLNQADGPSKSSNITELNSKKSRLTPVHIQARSSSHYSRDVAQQEIMESSQLPEIISSDIQVAPTKFSDNQPENDHAIVLPNQVDESSKSSNVSELNSKKSRLTPVFIQAMSSVHYSTENFQPTESIHSDPSIKNNGNQHETESKKSETSPLTLTSIKDSDRKPLFDRATEWFPEQVFAIDEPRLSVSPILSKLTTNLDTDVSHSLSSANENNENNKSASTDERPSTSAQTNMLPVSNSGENRSRKRNSDPITPNEVSIQREPATGIPKKVNDNLKVSSKEGNDGPSDQLPQKVLEHPKSNVSDIEAFNDDNSSNVNNTTSKPSRIPQRDASSFNVRVKEAANIRLEEGHSNGPTIGVSPPSKLPLPKAIKTNTNNLDILETSPRIPDRRRRRKDQEGIEEPLAKSMQQDVLSSSDPVTPDTFDIEDRNEREFVDLSGNEDDERVTEGKKYQQKRKAKSENKTTDSVDLQTSQTSQNVSEVTPSIYGIPSPTSTKPSRIPRRKYDLESSFETLYEPRRRFKLPGVLPFREAQSRDDGRKNGSEKRPILSSIIDCEDLNREDEDWLCSSASSTASVDHSAPANLMRDSRRYNSNQMRTPGVGEDFGGDSTLSSRSMSPSLSVSSDMDISGAGGTSLRSRFVLNDEMDLVPPIFLDKNISQLSQTASADNSPDIVAQMLSNASLTYGYNMIHSSNDFTNY